MARQLTSETARTLRALWFDYLDSIEAIRPKLHGYCLRLTGSVWDAEDLVQDTLLRGFGAMGRCDHSPPLGADGRGGRWFDKPQAYLAQIATNLWIDRQRRRKYEVDDPESDAGFASANPVVTRAAGAALFERAAPQERAAIVLKDVFDFSLEDIAEMLSTTTGAVKAALHRGREKLGDGPEPASYRNKPASPELIDRFIAAFNARDVPSVTSILLESVTYEPQGVGGERGHGKAIWLNVPRREGVVAEAHTASGERVVAYTYVREGQKYLVGLNRLEEVAGKVSRIVNYYFCPDTLAHVANELGMAAWSVGYHQTGETLARMIADAGLPWSTESG